MKLSHQFKSGGNGGKRISDQVGAGAEIWDERAKSLIPKEVNKIDVGDMLLGKGSTGIWSILDVVDRELIAGQWRLLRKRN